MTDVNFDKLLKLKKKVAELQREADRAEGALRETMKTLKEEFEVESLEEAEKLLASLEKKEKKAAEKFNSAMQEFEEKWSDSL